MHQVPATRGQGGRCPSHNTLPNVLPTDGQLLQEGSLTALTPLSLNFHSLCRTSQKLLLTISNRSQPTSSLTQDQLPASKKEKTKLLPEGISSEQAPITAYPAGLAMTWIAKASIWRQADTKHWSLTSTSTVQVRARIFLFTCVLLLNFPHLTWFLQEIFLSVITVRVSSIITVSVIAVSVSRLGTGHGTSLLHQLFQL